MRIVALGLTYRDHARETGEKIDREHPALFERDPLSLSSDGQVRLPTRGAVCAALDRLEPGLGSELGRRHPDFPILLDYEIELGVAVLDGGQLGYCLCNDITVRTVQLLGEGMPNRMAYWGAAKSFAGTLLRGPVRLTDNGAAIPRLPLTLRVNGELRQSSHTDELIYGPAELLRFAGSVKPLVPGDLILTGTPGGIALSVPRWKRMIADLVLDRWGKLKATFSAARNNPRFLRPGDLIEMDGGPLGALRATVVAD
jgi:2-keto-4-pentenoate hydratase/2-oxohepta-3-ene-1,7-dioic acid hydratase in catechol pathway